MSPWNFVKLRGNIRNICCRINIHRQYSRASHSWDCEQMFTYDTSDWLVWTCAWYWCHVAMKDPTDHGTWQHDFMSGENVKYIYQCGGGTQFIAGSIPSNIHKSTQLDPELITTVYNGHCHWCFSTFTGGSIVYGGSIVCSVVETLQVHSFLKLSFVWSQSQCWQGNTLLHFSAKPMTREPTTQIC